jgi:hypothetical protein
LLTDYERLDRNSITDSESRHILAERDNLATDLVSHCDLRWRRKFATVEMKIGTTDATVAHADDRPAG